VLLEIFYSNNNFFIYIFLVFKIKFKFPKLLLLLIKKMKLKYDLLKNKHELTKVLKKIKSKTLITLQLFFPVF